MKTVCPYCGHNPVPHWLYWYEESLNVLLTPIRQWLMYNPLTRFFKRSFFRNGASWALLRLGLFLGILLLQKDPAKCKVRRAQVLWEEAQKRGIEMSELLLFGKPIDVYVAEKKNPKSLILNSSPLKIKDKGLRIVFSGLPRPQGHVNNWLELMDDKFLLKQKLQSADLPVPSGGCASTVSRAEEIFNLIQSKGVFRPVIVKPRAGSRGRHTTTNIYNKEDLKKAFKIAKQLCYWVIVEEQLFGPVYRATVINGQLAGVLRGDAPKVTGDGSLNIGQLIKAKNTQPRPGVKDIVPDAVMERFLVRAIGEKYPPFNFPPILGGERGGRVSVFNIIPAKGETIALSEKIGVGYGGSSSEDYEICHPDNKELFLRAAKVLGDPIVGFDFIIPDITVSYKNQKCGFIEANSLPFINLHHDPLLGTPRNAAAMVWEMVGW